MYRTFFKDPMSCTEMANCAGKKKKLSRNYVTMCRKHSKTMDNRKNSHRFGFDNIKNSYISGFNH